MKILLVVLGCISCVLGIVGIFVPPAAYHAVPVAIGGLLGAFFAPALRLAARTPLFRLMWGTMLYCIFALLTAWWWAQAALLAVAIGVTWHILSFATLKKGVPVQEDPEGE